MSSSSSHSSSITSRSSYQLSRLLAFKHFEHSNIYVRLLNNDDEIRNIYEMEKDSYPDDEAATHDGLLFRYHNAGDYFIGAFSKDNDNEETLIGFVNGTLTKNDHLNEESMATHEPDGHILCIHSVCIGKNFRRRGFGRSILLSYIDYIIKEFLNIKQIHLIAKAYLMEFYVSCGFKCLKQSPTVWGRDKWFDFMMDLNDHRNGGNFYIINAFTKKQFHGNNGTIILTDGVLLGKNGWNLSNMITKRTNTNNMEEENIMKNIAIEMNSPITAFITFKTWLTNKIIFNIIYYNNYGIEIDLCGHGSLGSTFILNKLGFLHNSIKSVILKTRNNIYIELSSNIDNNINMNYYTIKLPIININYINKTDELLNNIRKSLNLIQNNNDNDIIYIGDNNQRLMIELDNISFQSFIPNYNNMKLYFSNYKNFIITSNANTDEMKEWLNDIDQNNINNNIDFVSRTFLIHESSEDQVTGSSHCILGKYWKEKKNQNILNTFQCSERGGYLSLSIIENEENQIHNEENKINDEETNNEYIEITGNVQLIAEGKLRLCY